MLTGSHAFFFHLTNILLHSGLVYRIHSTLLRFGHRCEIKYSSKIALTFFDNRKHILNG